MKILPPGLQDHLDGRATTMSHCWRLTRRDGLVQGFTDHDEDLTFDGTTFLASSGFTASQVQHSLGLAVDNLNVEGGLSSSSLNEDDLAAGLYDDAYIELFWVNWRNVAQRLVLQTGYTGETKRSGVAFSAELRGLKSRLGQVLTRTVQRTCGAVVGDARCGVNLNTGEHKGTGAVATVFGPRTFGASGLSAFDTDWFSQGVLTWTSGPNAGIRMDVKGHLKEDGGGVILELWAAPAFALETSWAFDVTVGCQLTATMCHERFGNIANFRGFNMMPGNDAVIRNPDPNAANTGSSTTTSSK